MAKDKTTIPVRFEVSDSDEEEKCIGNAYRVEDVQAITLHMQDEQVSGEVVTAADMMQDKEDSEEEEGNGEVQTGLDSFTGEDFSEGVGHSPAGNDFESYHLTSLANGERSDHVESFGEANIAEEVNCYDYAWWTSDDRMDPPSLNSDNDEDLGVAASALATYHRRNGDEGRLHMNKVSGFGQTEKKARYVFIDTEGKGIEGINLREGSLEHKVLTILRKTFESPYYSDWMWPANIVDSKTVKEDMAHPSTQLTNLKRKGLVDHDEKNSAWKISIDGQSKLQEMGEADIDLVKQ